MIEIVEIDEKRRDKYNQKLLDFEKIFKYPLGVDYFRIGHGVYYYNFFYQLGKPRFLVAEENDQIVGICVCVLREIDIYNKGAPEFIWYLCDLKIHPEYRGKFIYNDFLKYDYNKFSKISSKIYSISMNNHNGTNKLINMARRLKSLQLKVEEIIEFYLLDSTQQGFVESFLIKNGGSFISLKGIKDLILYSADSPLPFSHYSKKHKEKFQEAFEGAKQYMFCCAKNSSVSKSFQEVGLSTAATASIIANFIPNSWNFIESGEV